MAQDLGGLKGCLAALTTFLKSLTMPATVTLELGLPMPLRIYSRIGTRSSETWVNGLKTHPRRDPRIPGACYQGPEPAVGLA